MVWDNLLQLNILQHFHSWGQTQQECSRMLPKDLYKNVSNNTMAIALMALVPVSSRLGKQRIVYAQDGLGASNGNAWTSLICSIMHESYTQSAEWQKPDTTARSQNPTDVNVKGEYNWDMVLEIRSSYSGKRCGRPRRLAMCVSWFGCCLHGCGLRILIKSCSEVMFNFYCAWVLSHFTCVRLFGTPWTFACQAPWSMEFSRQEYWSGLPCPPPGDLSDSEIKPTSLMSHALAGRFFTTNATWEVQLFIWYIQLWWFSC